MRLWGSAKQGRWATASLAGVAAMLAFSCTSATCPEGYTIVEYRCVADGVAMAQPAGACSATQVDCDGDAGNGCETDVQSARDHCGACGQVCGWAPCVAGQCDDPTQLATTTRRSCALLKSGRVVCWGENDFGRLGNGETASASYTTTPMFRPVYVRQANGAALDGVQSVSVGGEFSCALRRDGRILCWGKVRGGGLGNPSWLVRPLPAPVIDNVRPGQYVPVQAKLLAVGFAFACAVRSDGTVGCWGRNDYGELGRGDKVTAGLDYLNTPALFSTANPSDPVVGFGLGEFHGCALRQGGTVQCWGDSTRAQTGTLSGDPTAIVPTPVPAVSGVGVLTEVQQVVGDAFFSCALLRSSQVVCWGNDDRGQLGDGSKSINVHRATPVYVVATQGSSPLSGVRSLSSGDYNTYALLEDGRVLAWGYNGNNEFGIGQPVPEDRAVPDYVLDEAGSAALEGIEELDCGESRCCARRATGGPLCWGNFSATVAGAATVIPFASPTPVLPVEELP